MNTTNKLLKFQTRWTNLLELTSHFRTWKMLAGWVKNKEILFSLNHLLLIRHVHQFFEQICTIKLIMKMYCSLSFQLSKISSTTANWHSKVKGFIFIITPHSRTSWQWRFRHTDIVETIAFRDNLDQSFLKNMAYKVHDWGEVDYIF